MATLAAVAAMHLALWGIPTSEELVEGQATYYAEGVMAKVAVNRGYIADVADYRAWLEREGLVGTVALNAAGDLGRWVYLEGPQGVEGPFLSIDCAQRDHYVDRVRRGRVVEVDWWTAQRWGMRGPVAVRVLFSGLRSPAPVSESLLDPRLR